MRVQAWSTDLLQQMIRYVNSGFARGTSFSTVSPIVERQVPNKRAIAKNSLEVVREYYRGESGGYQEFRLWLKWVRFEQAARKVESTMLQKHCIVAQSCSCSHAVARRGDAEQQWQHIF